MANWTPWLVQDDHGNPLSPITNIETLIEEGVLFKSKFDELEAEISNPCVFPCTNITVSDSLSRTQACSL